MLLIISDASVLIDIECGELTSAKHEGCQLLTGDKALRDVAKELNV